MKVVDEFDYRNAKAVLEATRPHLVRQVASILNSQTTKVNLSAAGGQRELSRQLAEFFFPHGWLGEQPVFTLPDLRYDLLKDGIPLELEIGHQRLVYADFFKFLADYSQSRIPAGIMIVTGTPDLYGHSWHNSLASTKKKLEAVSTILFVPILVFAVDP